MPKISICSSTYNHEKYVTEAINSVLKQTCQDFELIITDDASTDNNVKKIQQFQDSRIKLFCHETNRGNMVASANCYQHSSGEYITWLTTDDVWEPIMLEVLSNYLDQNPDVLGVFGQASFIDEESNPHDFKYSFTGVGLNRFQHLHNLFKVNNYFVCPAAMIRRSALEKVGYFFPHLRQIHDMAHWILLLFAGELVILPEHVLKFRLRNDNANAGSNTPENYRRINFEVFENLRSYVAHIHDVDLLCKIFPEVKKHPWPLNDKLIPFHIAHIAFAQNTAVHRLFGLDLLYKLMSYKTSAEYLKSTCQFDYPDLYKLEGEKALFADYNELSKGEAQLIQEITLLKQMLKDGEDHRQQLEQVQQGILSSTPWKMFSLFRQVKSRLAK